MEVGGRSARHACSQAAAGRQHRAAPACGTAACAPPCNALAACSQQNPLRRSPCTPADTVLAVVAPRAPPKAVREAVAGGPTEEDDDPLRLRLPPDAPAWQRSALRFAQRRLHVPEALLALLVAVSARAWLGLGAWACGARLAAAYELGPPYIVCTLLALMLLNLGQRQEGEWRWAACCARLPAFRRPHLAAAMPAPCRRPQPTPPQPALCARRHPPCFSLCFPCLPAPPAAPTHCSTATSGACRAR